MYRMWLFPLCVFLFLQSDMMVIDTFEDDGNWERTGSPGCTLELFLDQAIKREGSSSLRLEAVFPEDCDDTCYAGIVWQAPDLSDYTFLRLWTRLQTTAVDLKIGCFTPDDEPYVYSAPKMTGWYLLEVTVSQFENGEGQPLQTFGDIDRIFLVLTSEEPITAQVHIDEFYALTDRNDNSIPDRDGTLRKIPLFFEENGQIYYNVALKLAIDHLGLYHKQIDPENLVLVGPKGEVKIPLFGGNQALINWTGAGPDGWGH